MGHFHKHSHQKKIQDLQELFSFTNTHNAKRTSFIEQDPRTRQAWGPKGIDTRLDLLIATMQKKVAQLLERDQIIFCICSLQPWSVGWYQDFHTDSHISLLWKYYLRHTQHPQEQMCIPST